MEQVSSKENKNYIELEYESAKTSRRVGAAILDLLMSLLLSFILLGIEVGIINNIPSYTNLLNEQETILISSKLYVKNSDENLIRISTFYNSNDDLTFNEKSEILDNDLTYFFSLDDFFPKKDGMTIYNKTKSGAKNSSGLLLFNEKYERNLVNADYDPDYYTFYCNTVENVAISYLSQNVNYYEVQKTIIILFSASILCEILFSLFIFIYIIPLFLKRGRQTLGMKIMKIGLINVDALNLKVSKFTLRFLIVYFFEIILSLVSFLIPLIVTFSFMCFSKAHQSFSDYVTNTYMVDVSSKDIYLDLEEYQKAQTLRQESSLENNDFKLY